MLHVASERDMTFLATPETLLPRVCTCMCYVYRTAIVFKGKQASGRLQDYLFQLHWFGTCRNPNMASTDSVKAEAIKDCILKCPVPQVLQDQGSEFEKAVYRVADGVHVAVGFAFANSILLEAPEGLIIIETTESTVSMKEIWKEFRKISDKPLKGVIYTHSIGDHIAGTEALVQSDAGDLQICAHENFIFDRAFYETCLKGAMRPRVIRQFAMVDHVMPPPTVNCGIGPRVCNSIKRSCIKPNEIMKGEGVKHINIGGLPIQLMYHPGHTRCHISVWIPSKKVLMPGDLFYKAFPLLYSLRGHASTSAPCWIKSLDTMRKLCPEHLVPSHTKPISGEADVVRQLTNYRDAIQFVHDQTLRLMNRGLHPVEIAKSITLPPTLRENPFLQTVYGTPEWSSRAVFGSYIGWFSGNPEELFSFTPSERGTRMVKAFGADKILQEAEGALKGDLQWALELSTHVFLSDPANNKAKELRSQALLDLAAQQTSACARHYFLIYILEDHGILPKRYPISKEIFDKPLDIVFKHMAICIKAETVEGVTMTVVMTFKDVNKSHTLYIRNCILEVREEKSEERDICITMDSQCLKQILCLENTAEQLLQEERVVIDKPKELFIKFFSYFET